MKKYFEKINYSSLNEDSNSEIKVLQLSEHDKVLCITGSGSRVLDLIIQKPKIIYAVDFNPCQNYLLELKIAAIKYLDYEDYISFLGLIPSKHRLKIFNGISSSLSNSARYFWERNTDLIKRGVIYQGGWEKYFRNLSKIINNIRPKLLKQLFDCVSVDEQKVLWKELWDDRAWRFFIRIISLRFTWKYFFGDPGFYKYVPNNFSIENYLNDRFASASENLIFSQSPFINLLFKGKFNLDTQLPLHLQRDKHLILIDNLNNIQIKTGSLLYIFNIIKDTFFNAFSLSDFASYVNDMDYKKIWNFILKKAQNNARVCERQFLVKRNIPLNKSELIIRDYALEKELEKTDNSIFYSFIAARINK